MVQKSRRASEAGLKFALGLVLLLGFLSWLFYDGDSTVGKNPADEEVIHSVEKDTRTGRIYDVEIVKCKLCGSVISYVRFDRGGLPVSGQFNKAHVCKRYVKNVPALSPLDLGQQEIDFRRWLLSIIDRKIGRAGHRNL